MLAPEPFFEPRGTPFSEYHRLKALSELGHQVDLVTYPIGRDVDIANLRIYRAWRPPFVRRVRIGPSPTKLLLDALMLFTIAGRVLRTRYDAIHSHEEMGLVGSEHYIADPLVPLKQTVAMLNLDMVGRLRKEHLTVSGTGTAANFAPLVERLGAKYGFRITQESGGYGPSDHASFF